MLTQTGMLVHVIGLLGEENHGRHGQQHGHCGDAVHRLPTELLRQRRGYQDRHRRAYIARAHQAHRQALVARGKGARAQAERYAKAGPGNAQQHAHGQQAVVRADVEIAKEQGHHDEGHFYQGGILAPYVLGQHAQRESH